MASTITNASLNVVLRETVTLNGKEYGSRLTFDVPGVNEVSQRIFTVPTSQVTVMSLGTTPSAGGFSTTGIKYCRVSNLDDENFVRLSFMSGSSNQFDVKLDPKRTYVFTNAQISGSSSGATFNSYVNFTDLKAVANSASVDIELFVASS
jgi:hypothetical protein